MNEFITNVMNKTGTNGRIVSHSSGKIILYDCPYWSNKASSYVHFQNPNVVVSIEQCHGSLSGFIIVFEEKKSIYARRKFIVALSVSFLIFCLLYALHNSSWILQFEEIFNRENALKAVYEIMKYII